MAGSGDATGVRCAYRNRMPIEPATRDEKAAVRALWALGDYRRFARETVWEVGPVLVEATGVGPGMRVLDVAAGTGNVAIRAAQAGAAVVATDLTPEQLAAGRREARTLGVELEWVEADAQMLPFGDASFDIVTSSFGAMFAPDHGTVADELLRVCKPGGTIGMANFTADRTGGAFFALVGRYLPPPPEGSPTPLLWGDEDHVRGLFGDRVASLELTRRTYVERSASPQAYAELFRAAFGPVVALRLMLADDPVRAAAFDRELDEFAAGYDQGVAGGPAEYPYDYLLVIAHKRQLPAPDAVSWGG